MARKNNLVDAEPTEVIENKEEQTPEVKEEPKKVQNEGKKLFSKEGGTRLS